jgi:hypothetical protein
MKVKEMNNRISEEDMPLFSKEPRPVTPFRWHFSYLDGRLEERVGYDIFYSSVKVPSRSGRGVFLLSGGEMVPVRFEIVKGSPIDGPTFLVVEDEDGVQG